VQEICLGLAQTVLILDLDRITTEEAAPLALKCPTKPSIEFVQLQLRRMRVQRLIWKFEINSAI